MPGSAPETGGSHEGPNVDSILSTLTHDYPSVYLTYTAKIMDKLSSNNTANAVVADACGLLLSLKDQQFADRGVVSSQEAVQVSRMEVTPTSGKGTLGPGGLIFSAVVGH